MGNRNGDRKSYRKRSELALLAVIGMIAVAGCAAEGKEGGAAAVAAAESGLRTVSVQPIVKKQISGPVEQIADVVASGQTDITAKTAADVLEVVAERGDRVQKGDVLIRLDDTDAALALDQARLAYENAKLALATGRKQWQHNVAQLEQALSEATKTYNKMRNDYDQGLVDKSDLDRAENAYTNLSGSWRCSRKHRWMPWSSRWKLPGCPWRWRSGPSIITRSRRRSTGLSPAWMFRRA